MMMRHSSKILFFKETATFSFSHIIFSNCKYKLYIMQRKKISIVFYLFFKCLQLTLNVEICYTFLSLY